jgi:hypothetical protein
VEFFRVPVIYKKEVQEGIEVYIGNILATHAAIDLQRSNYQTFVEYYSTGEDKPWANEIQHFTWTVANPDNDPRPRLFREQSFNYYVCCNEAFRSACREHKMRLTFMPLDSAEQEKWAKS